jgi:hypothetical protein
MSNPTSNFGWQMPTATDLVTDLPADFEVFGQAVDTDLADLNGGTTGQVLSKTSGTDLDFTWVDPTAGDITGVTAGTGISGGGTSGDVTVTNSMATAFTTSGDLIQATGSGTFARLGTGTNGQYLTTNGTTNSWGSISAGGLTLLSTTTLSGATTTVSGISQDYKDLKILVIKAISSNISEIAGFRVNGDAGSNYAYEAYPGYNNQNQTVVYYGLTTTSTDYDKSHSAEITINRYTETETKFMPFISYQYGGSYRTQIGVGRWNNTAAITSITLTAGAGTFSSGTVYIYGVS